MVLGFLFLTNEKFVEFSLSMGSGKKWVRILGMERAKKLTKYVFGSLLLLLGLVMLVVGAAALAAGVD
jgi:hypothetical protein